MTLFSITNEITNLLMGLYKEFFISERFVFHFRGLLGSLMGWNMQDLGSCDWYGLEI